jgi:putative hydrolase of HD superfamily
MMQPEELRQIVDFLKASRRFQHVLRFTPQPQGGHENDAEHSWAVAFACMVLASRLEKEFGVELDQLKMLKMALIHDLGEIGTGDTKTWDTAARVGKGEREREAMRDLLSEVPDDIRAGIMEVWEECEKKESLEAKIVKSVDRFDPVLHRTTFNIGWKGVVEDEHATAAALDARQLPRHDFSKTLTAIYEAIRDEAVQEGLFKV